MDKTEKTEAVTAYTIKIPFWAAYGLTGAVAGFMGASLLLLNGTTTLLDKEKTRWEEKNRDIAYKANTAWNEIAADLRGDMERYEKADGTMQQALRPILIHKLEIMVASDRITSDQRAFLKTLHDDSNRIGLGSSGITIQDGTVWTTEPENN